MATKLLLVAEDNDEDFSFFSEALSAVSPSTSVVRAMDGEELMKYLYSSRLPDLIVLDLRMPKMDGPEALRQIRANSIFKSIPVVVLSIRDDAVEKASLQKLGIDEYCLKPGGYDDAVRFVKEFARFGFEITV